MCSPNSTHSSASYLIGSLKATTSSFLSNTGPAELSLLSTRHFFYRRTPVFLKACSPLWRYPATLGCISRHSLYNPWYMFSAQSYTHFKKTALDSLFSLFCQLFAAHMSSPHYLCTPLDSDTSFFTFCLCFVSRFHLRYQGRRLPSNLPQAALPLCFQSKNCQFSPLCAVDMCSELMKRFFLLHLTDMIVEWASSGSRIVASVGETPRVYNRCVPPEISTRLTPL